MARRKVYVVDDEEPIRRAACLLLKISGFEPTSFDTGSALLNVADALMPGCVLLDMRMPEIDGIEIQRALGERGSVHPIVIMTGHGDVQSAVAAFEGGAVGFIEKPFSKAQLLDALDLAFLKLEHPEGFAQRLAAAEAQLAELHEEERAFLAGLASGRSNEEIASELGLQTQDLEVKRARIFERLRVESIAGALNIAFAAKLGARP